MAFPAQFDSADLNIEMHECIRAFLYLEGNAIARAEVQQTHLPKR